MLGWTADENKYLHDFLCSYPPLSVQKRHCNDVYIFDFDAIELKYIKFTLLIFAFSSQNKK